MERSLAADLAYAARSLRKAPAFAATAIITIALGIGATTAIFSVVHAVLLRPLPYSDADRLVYIQGDLAARNVLDFPMAPGDFPDLKEQGTLFASVAGVVTFRQPLIGDGEPERIRAAAATPNLLGMLGMRAELGRLMVEADGAVPPPPDSGQAPVPGVAVLSHAFWQRRFGGDRTVLGRTLQLGGGQVEIVGVLAPDAELLFPPRLNVERLPDVWTALRVDWATASRTNVFLRIVATLKPGVTREQAQAQADQIVAGLKERFPIKNTAGLRWRVEPMHDYIVADVKSSVVALMGAVAFVLLIACANVGNLLLVRAGTRERELVVRSALGASRRDLVRQMLAESVLIAGVAGALGVMLAVGGTAVLRSMAPANLPRIDDIGLNLPVLGFAALAALTAAALFGIVPALRASRLDAGAVLRAASRTGGLAGGRMLRSAVVVVEVALCFVLLVGSGLMIRSFVALSRVDPGYDPGNLLTMIVQAGGLNNPGARAAFQRDLADRLRGLPGVTGVTAASPLPLDGGSSLARWGTAEALTDPSKFQQADFRTVLPGYFEVMRTRLIEGRVFDASDNDTGRTQIVIDRVLAAKAFPGESAVGKRLLARLRGPEPEWLDVIGVVEHQRHTSLASEGRETVYVVDGFFGHGGANRWVLRTAGDPMLVATAARGEVARLAPSAPVDEVQPMQALVDRAMAPTRFALALIGVFAVIAAVLAAVGLYGVLATSVRQRTAEIGIRMTFGAPRAGIFRLIIGHGLGLSAAGIGFGLIAAIALTRVMRSLLIGVEPTDPATFVVMVAAFLAVAAVASWLPARRAAGLDPAVALRDE